MRSTALERVQAAIQKIMGRIGAEEPVPESPAVPVDPSIAAFSGNAGKAAAGLPFSAAGTAAVLEDVLASSGKMIRPRLLLLASAFGPEGESKLERLSFLAAMVELTHLASLVHDDIIDNAHFRRGKPSIQHKYGRDAAVYAGDLLITRVNYWGIREGFYDAVECLAKTVEEMCVGEIGQAVCRYREDVTAGEYLRNIRGKTASLFRTACFLGARESRACRETAETLAGIGECMGMMFQLRDDLSDFTKEAPAAGKETHKDFQDGIYTLPVLMAMQIPAGREALLPIIRKNKEQKLSPGEIRQMEQHVSGFGGMDATKDAIHQYFQKCTELLDRLEAAADDASAGTRRTQESALAGIREILQQIDFDK